MQSSQGDTEMVQTKVTQGSSWTEVKCAYCQGRGTDRWGGSGKCPACGGKGVNHVRKPYVVCAFCRGSGVHQDARGFYKRLTCTTCSGKGVVAVPGPVQTCPACGGLGRRQTGDLSCTVCSGRGVVAA
jgi:DnaJ-class molecular chaperone